jgi:hypothetical protein
VTSVSTRVSSSPLQPGERQAPPALPFARGAPAILSRLLQQICQKRPCPAAAGLRMLQTQHDMYPQRRPLALLEHTVMPSLAQCIQ